MCHAQASVGRRSWGPLPYDTSPAPSTSRSGALPRRLRPRRIISHPKPRLARASSSSDPGQQARAGARSRTTQAQLPPPPDRAPPRSLASSGHPSTPAPRLTRASPAPSEPGRASASRFPTTQPKPTASPGADPGPGERVRALPHDAAERPTCSLRSGAPAEAPPHRVTVHPSPRNARASPAPLRARASECEPIPHDAAKAHCFPPRLIPPSGPSPTRYLVTARSGQDARVGTAAVRSPVPLRPTPRHSVAEPPRPGPDLSPVPTRGRCADRGLRGRGFCWFTSRDGEGIPVDLR